MQKGIDIVVYCSIIKYMENHFYTVKEVAKLLQVHEESVRRWINKGLIKAIKIGKSYRISQSTIEEIINN